MSPATPSPTLLQFLREEIRALDAEHMPAEIDAPAHWPSDGPFRVPLELGGALWSAEVEEIEPGSLQLIVDRQAIEEPDARIEGTIQYQPENCPMRRVTGTVTAGGFLPSNRIRLNFELR